MSQGLLLWLNPQSVVVCDEQHIHENLLNVGDLISLPRYLALSDVLWFKSSLPRRIVHEIVAQQREITRHANRLRPDIDQDTR